MDAEYRLIATRGEFDESLRQAFVEIAERGCREVWLCDPDFADWPLDDAVVLDALKRWAMPHRRLTVIARHFDALSRRHPRWVAWRRLWSHGVDCRVLDASDAAAAPVLLLAPGVVTVRLLDVVHPRGSVSRAAADALRARELIDAISQRSSEGFPTSVLGL